MTRPIRILKFSNVAVKFVKRMLHNYPPEIYGFQKYWKNKLWWYELYKIELEINQKENTQLGSACGR